jgi:hypothetical protein
LFLTFEARAAGLFSCILIGRHSFPLRIAIHPLGPASRSVLRQPVPTRVRPVNAADYGKNSVIARRWMKSPVSMPGSPFGTFVASYQLSQSCRLILGRLQVQQIA